MENKFTGELKILIDKAKKGDSSDVDFIMEELTDDSTFAKTRYVDFALSLIKRSEGMERIIFYLFNGTLIQRNYASLFLNRHGELELVKQAYGQGLIDEVQAFSR